MLTVTLMQHAALPKNVNRLNTSITILQVLLSVSPCRRVTGLARKWIVEPGTNKPEIECIIKAPCRSLFHALGTLARDQSSRPHTSPASLRPAIADGRDRTTGTRAPAAPSGHP